MCSAVAPLTLSFSMVFYDWDAHIASIFRNKMSSDSAGRYADREVHFSGAFSLILKPVSVAVACYLLNHEDPRK